MGTYVDNRGYVRLLIPRTRFGQTNILLHRKVWEDYYGPIPAGRNIHHKDRDKTNNHISNLELLDTLSHSRYYFRWYRLDDGSWLKPCLKCGVHKPLVYFGWRRSHISDSVNSYCRPCKRRMMHDHRARPLSSKWCSSDNFNPRKELCQYGREQDG